MFRRFFRKTNLSIRFKKNLNRNSSEDELIWSIYVVKMCWCLPVCAYVSTQKLNNATKFWNPPIFSICSKFWKNSGLSVLGIVNTITPKQNVLLCILRLNWRSASNFGPVPTTGSLFITLSVLLCLNTTT